MDSIVTVSMPVWNCENTIAATIRSIINQSIQGWTLHVIDDGSTDGTMKVLSGFRDPRIKVRSDGEHKGLPARLNESITQISSKYIARMDGDDIAYPQRFEKQIEFLECNPDVDLLGAWMMVFGANGVAIGKRVGPTQQERMPRGILRSVPIGHPTFMARRNWLVKFGYLEWPMHFQDQNLLLRSFKQSKFAVLPEVLLGYREEGLSVRKQTSYRMSYVKSFPELRSSLGLLTASAIIGIQFAKLGMDVAAISTGIGHKILRHRAQRISSTEREEWERVWRSANE